jgi:enterochelin esterase-like enzyme
MQAKHVSLALSAILLALPACAQTTTPCQATHQGELRIEHFTSKIFPYPQTVRIWLPPGYDAPANAHRTYPVLYMFDGQNLFDACGSMNNSSWQIDHTLTQLIAAGKVQPLIVVGIDAPDDGPKRASELLPIPDPVVHYDSVHGERLPDFMATEVMPRVQKEFRIRTGRASTAIGGASYGGVAAIYLLIHMPDQIGVGLIESPSVSPGNGAIARWTQQLDVAPLRVSIAVGDIESHQVRKWLLQLGLDPDANDRAFVRITHAVADNFREAAGPPSEDSAVRFNEDPQGMHTEATWARRFPDAIQFLFPPTPPSAAR